MRFEVPQFIEVEDKIFGPFTWKQFIFLAGGAGAALILYFLLPLILFAMIGLPIVGLSGFLAFHKVNNRPFSSFLESVFQYFSGKKLYLWRKEKQQSVIITDDNPNLIEISVMNQPRTYTPPESKQQLAKLTHKLELNSLDQT